MLATAIPDAKRSSVGPESARRLQRTLACVVAISIGTRVAFAARFALSRSSLLEVVGAEQAATPIAQPSVERVELHVAFFAAEGQDLGCCHVRSVWRWLTPELSCERTSIYARDGSHRDTRFQALTGQPRRRSSAATFSLGSGSRQNSAPMRLQRRSTSGRGRRPA